MQKALLDTQSKIKIERATEGLKKWFITRLDIATSIVFIQDIELRENLNVIFLELARH